MSEIASLREVQANFRHERKIKRTKKRNRISNDQGEKITGNHRTLAFLHTGKKLTMLVKVLLVVGFGPLGLVRGAGRSQVFHHAHVDGRNGPHQQGGTPQ